MVLLGHRGYRSPETTAQCTSQGSVSVTLYDMHWLLLSASFCDEQFRHAELAVYILQAPVPRRPGYLPCGRSLRDLVTGTSRWRRRWPLAG